jgi:hypothetical protein
MKRELIKKIRASYYSSEPAIFIDVHGHKLEYNHYRKFL